MSPWHSSFIQNKRGPIFRLSEYRELPLPIPGPGSLLPAPTCLYKKLNLDLLISWEQMVMDKRKGGGRVMLHLLIHTILFKEGFTHIALPGLFQERGQEVFWRKNLTGPWRSLSCEGFLTLTPIRNSGQHTHFSLYKLVPLTITFREALK